MNKNEQLAELLFGGIDKTPEYYEEKYPKRSLPEGAPVTRIGPSPTGFVHLGNLYNAIIGERLAHQNGGTFFLRIEDTDAKREVEGAVELVISAMDFFGIHFDEGASVDGDNGAYGPYRQRLRKEVYQCYAKELVKKGLAYPCFCSEDDLSKMREEQISDKLNFGYYGKWAKCRDLSIDDIKKRIENGDKYVLRFKSNGDENNHVEVYDGIRGMLNVSENYQDFVLLKSDGIPTYHFAHVIDDHLMRTTHVVRGEEWLSTLPIHVQLFDALGFDRPVYCHTAVLMKMDGDTKRKLSKRKDLTSWKQARDFFSFYFPETFKVEDEFPERVSKEDRYKILKQYLTSFNIKDDNSEWFQKIRDITESMGYAVKPKDFKKNPDMYKGSVSDVSGVIRVAITGRTNSPDLWEICQIIGEDEMTRRINLAIAG